MGKLFLCLLLSFSATAFAQKTNSSKLSYPAPLTPSPFGKMLHLQGVVGLNNSKLLADGKDSKIKDGYTLGVLAEVGSGQFVLESGLLYMQLGGRVVEGAGTMSLKTNYLVLPVFAKFYLDPRQTGFFGRAGVAYADRRSSKLIVNVPQFDVKEEIDFEHFVKNEDFMLGLGFGYLFEVSDAMGMSLELNYLQGTHRVMENLNSDGQSSTRNESYQLRASLRL